MDLDNKWVSRIEKLEQRMAQIERQIKTLLPIKDQAKDSLVLGNTILVDLQEMQKTVTALKDKVDAIRK